MCHKRAEECEASGRSFPAKHVLSLVLDLESDRIYCKELEKEASVVNSFLEALTNVAKKCRKNANYSSLPEICALSTVMGVDIRMVYPDKHTGAYRNMLNGRVRPRGAGEVEVRETMFIMWSCSSTKQALERPVRTNHFVALLPKQKLGPRPSASLQTSRPTRLSKKRPRTPSSQTTKPGSTCDEERDEGQRASPPTPSKTALSKSQPPQPPNKKLCTVDSFWKPRSTQLQDEHARKKGRGADSAGEEKGSPVNDKRQATRQASDLWF